MNTNIVTEILCAPDTSEANSVSIFVFSEQKTYEKRFSTDYIANFLNTPRYDGDTLSTRYVGTNYITKRPQKLPYKKFGNIFITVNRIVNLLYLRL